MLRMRTVSRIISGYYVAVKISSADGAGSCFEKLGNHCHGRIRLVTGARYLETCQAGCIVQTLSDPTRGIFP